MPTFHTHTHTYIYIHTHCIHCFTNVVLGWTCVLRPKWFKVGIVWATACILSVNWAQQTGAHMGLCGQATIQLILSAGPWGQAYQAQQLLHHAVSSEQSSILAKAVYYSQIQKANLAFSSLTGGMAIHWECSGVVWRTCKQSWHLKLSQYFLKLKGKNAQMFYFL